MTDALETLSGIRLDVTEAQRHVRTVYEGLCALDVTEAEDVGRRYNGEYVESVCGEPREKALAAIAVLVRLDEALATAAKSPCA